jgi:hypothetical protein
MVTGLDDECLHCGDTYHDLGAHYEKNYKGCGTKEKAGLDELGYTAETRPWRTQIHVLSIDYATAEFWFEIPGWTSDEVICKSLDILPWKVRLQFHQDFRCHARVNLGADDSDALRFSDWEAE